MPCTKMTATLPFGFLNHWPSILFQKKSEFGWIGFEFGVGFQRAYRYPLITPSLQRCPERTGVCQPIWRADRGCDYSLTSGQVDSRSPAHSVTSPCDQCSLPAGV